jgi:two-component system NtrC family sensor kinase
MDLPPSAPSAPPETPDETIRRLTAELREARDQQAATTEILDIINRSPGDLARVFDAILERAMNLCEASFGGLFIREGERTRAVATRGIPDRLDDFVRQGFVINPDRNPIYRGKAITHVLDLTKEPLADQPGRAAAVELGGARTMLGVALRKNDVLLGNFSVFRQEVRPFSEKQIALLESFAAQAVIAMENARLLTEPSRPRSSPAPTMRSSATRRGSGKSCSTC